MFVRDIEDRDQTIDLITVAEKWTTASGSEPSARLLYESRNSFWPQYTRVDCGCDTEYC